MPTKAQIYQAVFTWLQTESAIRVIKANQKGPRPARPYASLNFQNNSDEMGGDDQYYTDPTTGFTITEGPRKATASIQIFGDGANDLLSAVRNSLQRPDVIEAFDAAGIVILDVGQINDLTALQETIYEERAQIDLTVTYVVSSSVDLKTIDIVNLTGTLTGTIGDGTTTVKAP